MILSTHDLQNLIFTDWPDCLFTGDLVRNRTPASVIILTRVLMSCCPPDNSENWHLARSIKLTGHREDLVNIPMRKVRAAWPFTHDIYLTNAFEKRQWDFRIFFQLHFLICNSMDTLTSSPIQNLRTLLPTLSRTPSLSLRRLLPLEHPNLAKRKHSASLSPWLLHANGYIRPEAPPLPTRDWAIVWADHKLSIFFRFNNFNWESKLSSAWFRHFSF